MGIIDVNHPTLITALTKNADIQESAHIVNPINEDGKSLTLIESPKVIASAVAITKVQSGDSMDVLLPKPPAGLISNKNNESNDTN